jgi:putative oxidoreductase
MNTTVKISPVLALAARLLMAPLFLSAGIGKAMAFKGTVGYMGKLGLPAPELMTILAIAVEAGGAVLLILGWRTRWAAWGLAIFTAVATLLAHRFWDVDASQMVSERGQFLKNLAIMGGLLMMAAFGPGSASIDRR